jgi:hypothetical protein
VAQRFFSRGPLAAILPLFPRAPTNPAAPKNIDKKGAREETNYGENHYHGVPIVGSATRFGLQDARSNQ